MVDIVFVKRKKLFFSISSFIKSSKDVSGRYPFYELFLNFKETKTWILRCYACFHTTPLMEKVFCPKCGNKTLKRVSVTLNRDGTQQIHISMRRPLNRYSFRKGVPYVYSTRRSY